MPKKIIQSRSTQKNEAQNLASEAYLRQKTNDKRNQNKILNSLQSHYPKPMSTNDLIQNTGLDGATILKHGKELIKKCLVSRKDDDSKRATYELTPLALGNAAELRGQSFESMAYHKIMVQCIPAFNNKLIKKHIPKNTTSEEIELATFESKIGAYITYVMIEAMRDKH